MTPYRAQVGRMEEIYNRFGDQVEFFLVYVREAHPTDGCRWTATWKIPFSSGNINLSRNGTKWPIPVLWR